jgi:hypothetical protein
VPACDGLSWKESGSRLVYSLSDSCDGLASSTNGRHIWLKCSLASRHHHLFKTFHAGPAGWTEIQLPDGTIVWTSPRGRTYTTTPTGARFFPQLAMPTGTLILPNSPPPSPDRELAMPKRKRTRAQDRAYRVEYERALNRARYSADPPPF